MVRRKISATGCRLLRTTKILIEAEYNGNSFSIRAAFESRNRSNLKWFEFGDVLYLTELPEITLTKQGFASISQTMTSLGPDKAVAEVVATIVAKRCRIAIERFRENNRTEVAFIYIVADGYIASVKVLFFSELGMFAKFVRLPTDHLP